MLVAAILLAQIVTVQSSFLVSEGAVYVPSPAYFVKRVGPDVRMVWAQEGSRLVVTSDDLPLTPGSIDRALGKGTSIRGPQSLVSWERSTGTIRTVSALGPAVGFDQIACVGPQVVFTSWDSSAKKSLWVWSGSGAPKQIDLPEGFESPRFAASRKRAQLLVGGSGVVALLTAQTLVPVPALRGGVIVRGADADDRVNVIVSRPDTAEPTYALYDFKTGKAMLTSEMPEMKEFVAPFIMQTFENRPIFVNGEDELETTATRVAEEDGGFRLEIVERTGNPRRKMLLAPEASRFVNVSDDGLHFAYVDNGNLMVRSLIKVDKATQQKLLGTN